MGFKGLSGKEFTNEVALEKELNTILGEDFRDMLPCMAGFLVRTKRGKVITVVTTSTIGKLEVLGVIL